MVPWVPEAFFSRCFCRSIFAKKKKKKPSGTQGWLYCNFTKPDFRTLRNRIELEKSWTWENQKSFVKLRPNSLITPLKFTPPYHSLEPGASHKAWRVCGDLISGECSSGDGGAFSWYRNDGLLVQARMKCNEVQCNVQVSWDILVCW